MDHFLLNKLPKKLRRIIFLFVVVITIGYSFSLRQLYISVGTTPHQIEEHYNGNEDDENATEFKFKKNEKELLTFLHNHLISLGILLLILTTLLYFTNINENVKSFLVIEPFISLIVTFSSIYGLWQGIDWLKYITLISGVLFHLSITSILILLLVKTSFTKK